jgi:hypothetical protein
VFNVVLTLGAAILFLLTEDMRNPMILIDFWTLFHAVIFIVQIVVAILATRKKEEEEERDEVPAVSK